jgi:hypothetical protein
MNITKSVKFLKEAQHLLTPDDCDEALAVRIEFEDGQKVEVTVRDYNDECLVTSEGDTLHDAMKEAVITTETRLKKQFGIATELLQTADDLLSEPD